MGPIDLCRTQAKVRQSSSPSLNQCFIVLNRIFTMVRLKLKSNNFLYQVCTVCSNFMQALHINHLSFPQKTQTLMWAQKSKVESKQQTNHWINMMLMQNHGRNNLILLIVTMIKYSRSADLFRKLGAENRPGRSTIEYLLATRVPNGFVGPSSQILMMRFLQGSSKRVHTRLNCI